MRPRLPKNHIEVVIVEQLLFMNCHLYAERKSIVTRLMRPIQTPSKLPRVGTTIFTVMSQLAAKHGAVNLGQGFPDFDCDPQLQRRLTGAMQAAHNQYAPMTGVSGLREAIASKNQKLYGYRHDPETEITITSGATQGLMATILALLPAGDEVIVLEPAYDS